MKFSLSIDEKEKIYQTLTSEFIAAKQAKLNSCARLHIWLNKSFTQQILFKNKKAELEKIVKEHAMGGIDTSCELENTMA